MSNRIAVRSGGNPARISPAPRSLAKPGILTLPGNADNQEPPRSRSHRRAGVSGDALGKSGGETAKRGVFENSDDRANREARMYDLHGDRSVTAVLVAGAD